MEISIKKKLLLLLAAVAAVVLLLAVLVGAGLAAVIVAHAAVVIVSVAHAAVLIASVVTAVPAPSLITSPVWNSSSPCPSNSKSPSSSPANPEGGGRTRRAAYSSSVEEALQKNSSLFSSCSAAVASVCRRACSPQLQLLHQLPLRVGQRGDLERLRLLVLLFAVVVLILFGGDETPVEEARNFP